MLNTNVSKNESSFDTAMIFFNRVTNVIQHSVRNDFVKSNSKKCHLFLSKQSKLGDINEK